MTNPDTETDMTTRNTITALTALALAACAPEGAVETELTPDEQVAVDAAIENLEPMTADLPVVEGELETMAISDVQEARDYSNCEVKGVLSGVWYDEDYVRAIEGSWFELGTGELGGTLVGEYAEGAFSGSFGGTNTGNISGEYADGLFLGDWVELDGTDATGAVPLSEGEMIGRYERRNEMGGYFFGLWGQCD